MKEAAGIIRILDAVGKISSYCANFIIKGTDGYDSWDRFKLYLHFLMKEIISLFLFRNEEV